MQLDPATNIINTLKDIHFYLQLFKEPGEWTKEKYALRKHVLLLHIESINLSRVSYGLNSSTFTDRVENSEVRFQKDKSILNP